MPHLVATLIYLSQIYSYYIMGDMSPLNIDGEVVSRWEPVPDIFGIWDCSPRTSHGEASNGNGDVFRAKKDRQRATEKPLITTKSC